MVAAYALRWKFVSPVGNADEIVDCGTKGRLETELREKIINMKKAGWQTTENDAPNLSATFTSFDVTIEYSVVEA